MKPLAFLWTCSFVAFTVGAAAAVKAQDFDGIVSDEAAEAMSGQPLALILKTGVEIGDAEFVGPVIDRRTGGARFIEYRQGRRTTKTKAEDIYRLFIQGRPHSLRYHGPTGSHYLIDEKVANEQVLARLEKLGRRRLEPVTPDAMQEQNEEHLRFVEEAVKTMENPLLRVEENDFAILLTDFPVPQTKIFSQSIPAVFTAMNARFGLPPQQSVLPGKAIVACFQNRQNFARFEDRVMNNPNFGDSGTIFHWTNNRFVVSSHTRSFDAGSLRGICWGIAGGYVKRFYSDVELPTWLTMGLRSTIVDASLPTKGSAIQRDRRMVMAQIRRTSSLDGILQATNVSNERGALTKFLVQYLIHRDPAAVSQYVLDLKAGQEPEEALATNFGLTHEMFAAEVGRTLGIPNVRP